MPKPRNKEPVRCQIGLIEREAKEDGDAYIERERQRREAKDGEDYMYGKVYNRAVLYEEAVRRNIEEEQE